MDKITFYLDWKWLIKPLTIEEKGLLLDAIFTFCLTGQNAIHEKESETLKMAFGYISEEIKRDVARRKTISKLRRAAGLKSASLRKRKE